jgi:hypothetical protein
MSNTKQIKEQIFSNYLSIIKEYFITINKSDTIKNLVNVNSTLLIGLTAIHRTFEMILLKTKNMDTAFFYSKQAFYYFLEYMQQVRASDLLSSLNHMDAVLFVYKKTVCEVYDKESSSESINNLMTIHDNSVLMDENEMKLFMNDIIHYMNIFFFWNNEKITYENRYYLSQIIDKHIYTFEILKTIAPYLEVLQNKTDMTFGKYEEIIIELSKKIENRKPSTKNKQDSLFIKCYTESETFNNMLEDSSTKDLVKWLTV